MTVALVLFWAAALLLLWVYVAYPLLALAWAALRRPGPASGPDLPVLVSVAIAVHDGEADIEQRIANVTGQAVPFAIEVLVASDGSADATAAVVRRMAAADARIRLLDLERVGQAAAQAALLDAARGEVVVLTDVETRFAPRCLAALVAPFADPRVGCVTGVLHWRYDEETDTAAHESLYWRYEQAVRAWESRAGWLAAATGALLAFRRAVVRPVPGHASLDQMLPLLAREQGLAVVVAPEAIGSDRGTSARDEQFRARTRIATQGIEANLRMTLRVPPWRRPGPSLAIWSHKLLRWATPYLWLVLAICATLLFAAGQGLVYGLALALSLLVVLVGLLGYAAQRLGYRLPLVSLPLTVLSINVGFALAWWNVLLRRRIAAWDA